MLHSFGSTAVFADDNKCSDDDDDEVLSKLTDNELTHDSL